MIRADYHRPDSAPETDHVANIVELLGETIDVLVAMSSKIAIILRLASSEILTTF